MTLTEISYMIKTMIREGKIVDDDTLDTRLIKDWIDLKREQFISNKRSQNPNNRLHQSFYQKLPIAVSVVDPVTDAGDYPYSDSTTQAYTIVKSDETIPDILEDKSGPAILTVESQDRMKLPFSYVDYDRLRFSGNGKFNSGLIFGSIRDNYLYFNHNTFFDTYTNVELRAIFQNPRDVTGFNDDTSEYPANLALIEYIKNAIYDKDIRMFLNGQPDEQNDATGET